MGTDKKISRALISVTDKTGVVEFAQSLVSDYGVEIISTGGTARVLEEAGVPVIPIEEFTGFPEMMDGRVKTLHPKVHGGLLCRRDSEQHMAEAAEHGIQMIDLVCVNLYEFEKTVASPDVTFVDAIEHIDIGGPSMLRSAAKNNDSVTVVCDPDDYARILDEMSVHAGCTTLGTRRHLAAKVYTRTASYDTAISTWLNTYLANEDAGAAGTTAPAFVPPAAFDLHLEKAQDLRYGENPHQTAAVYRFADSFGNFASSASPLVGAEQIQGKPLSYNNFLDADAAWNAVREFEEPAVIILKHQNPCGSATGEDVTEAYDRAFACDPKSAFGGIIAANREVPLSLVEHFADVNKQFVEVLIAPSFSPEALERLSKRTNLRVLATGGADGHAQLEARTVDGGMLVAWIRWTRILRLSRSPLPASPRMQRWKTSSLPGRFARPSRATPSSSLRIAPALAWVPASPTALTPHCWPASAPRRPVSAWASRRAALPAPAMRSSRSATTSTCLPRMA